METRRVLDELSNTFEPGSPTAHLLSAIASQLQQHHNTNSLSHLLPRPAPSPSPLPHDQQDHSVELQPLTTAAQRRSTPPPPSPKAQSPSSTTTTLVLCSQCRRNLPIDKFPTRLANLEPYAVCLNHAWYWTNEKKAFWAPEHTVPVELAIQQFQACLNGMSSVECWLVNGSLWERGALVTKLVGTTGWTVKKHRVRKSRASLGPPPPQAYNYTLNPPTSLAYSAKPFKLNVIHHSSVNKFVLTLKSDDAFQTVGKAKQAWRKNLGPLKKRDREESEPPIWSDEEKALEEEQGSRGKDVQVAPPPALEQVPTPAEQDALHVMQVLEATLNQHHQTLAAAVSPQEQLEAGRRTPPKRQRIEMTTTPFATGGSLGIPTINLLPPTSFGDTPPSFSLIQSLNSRPPTQSGSTTPPHYTHPQPHRVPFVTAPLPYPVSPIRQPQPRPYSFNTPLTLADLLASPFLGSPPLPARIPRRRSPEKDATQLPQNGESDSDGGAESEVSDLNIEDVVDLEAEEEEEEESDEEEEEGEMDWLTDFVKGQLETGYGYGHDGEGGESEEDDDTGTSPRNGTAEDEEEDLDSGEGESDYETDTSQ